MNDPRTHADGQVVFPWPEPQPGQTEPGPESTPSQTPPIETAEVSSGETEVKTVRPQATVPTPEHSEETITRQASERTAAERKIENVEITTAEQEFIRKLAPHLGNSSRRIKRLGTVQIT